MTLQEAVGLEAFQLSAVFFRVAGMCMFLPGFRGMLSTRFRLSFALAFSFLVVPVVAPVLPPKPDSVIELTAFMVLETTVGVFLGSVPQFLLLAMDVAGNKISMGVGLRNARAFNPATESQTDTISVLLGMMATLVIFVTDLHHLFFVALLDSYSLFEAGSSLPWGDFSRYLTQTVNDSFLVGVRLASPFIIFSLLFHTALGLMARLNPKLNIFFITLPLKLFLGLGLLMISMSTIMMWGIRYFEKGFISFVAP